MDYKNDLQSDDDFDSSNGFNDHLTSNVNYNSNGQSRLSDINSLSKAELRKTNKPIMEKRRRARINHCLNELKSLILEAMKKDPARHTKLEKADILEMTVKHLQSVQRQQLNMAIQSDPNVIHKFKTGFVECAEEVTRYVSQLDGIDGTVRQGLANHLQKCANNLDQIGSMSNFNNGYCGNMSNILTNSQLASATITAPTATLFPTLPHDLNNNSNHAASGTPIQMGGVQLIPSRLPSGELALIVPNPSTNTVLNRAASTITPFAVWPPPLVQLPPQLANATLPHNIVMPNSAEFAANHQQNISAFTKPITLAQQQPHKTAVKTEIKNSINKNFTATDCITLMPKVKIQQAASINSNNFAQNSSTTTTSPPLSPISSISSHGGDESSPMHTSSEFVVSRAVTPPQNISLMDKQNFSGVFSTPPSSADSSLSLLSSSNSSTHLQQQQVTSTSGRETLNSRKRSLNSTTTDSADSSDEPSVKKFVKRNDLSTDDEGSCWRPW